MLKILKRLNKNIKFKKKIFGFDVETYQEYNEDGVLEQKFLCGSVVGDGIKPYFTKDPDDLAEFMLSKPFKNAYIYATQLEFDFMHTFQFNKKLMKDMFMIYKNGIIYACYKKYKKDKFHFLDTYNYTGKISLKKMGDLLNLPKLDHPRCFTTMPKDFDEWQEMKAYNIRDSEITYRFAKFFCYDFCKSLRCKPKITIASTGQDYWRRNHQPIDIFQEKRYIIDKHFLGSMHGGRTEVFHRGLLNFKQYYYDFNSHYPACCRDGFDGKGSYPNPSTARYSRNISETIIKYYEGITNIDLYCPHMHIPLLGITNKEGKYIFPKGNISGWFTNIEIREALKLGYEIQKIHEGIYYHGTFKPFREAVKELYKLRLQYKKDGNDIMQMLTKVMMNSALFGKFAQKIDNKTIIHNLANLIHDGMGGMYYMKNGRQVYVSDYNLRGEFLFENIKVPRRIPIFIMPILASYTTALGRIKLHRYMRKEPHKVIYCDTDSIVTMGRSFETSDRLGDLKLEHEIDHSIFIKPKFYYINNGVYDIFKSKGIGKIKDKDAFDCLLQSKKVSRRRFLRLKESFVRKMPFSAIVDSQKQISLEDDKRSWVAPFSLEFAEMSRAISL